MDYRDFLTWRAEAERRALWRRSDMYSAALLPNQREDAIRSALGKLDIRLYELDHESEIAAVEKIAKERLEKMREKRRRKRRK